MKRVFFFLAVFCLICLPAKTYVRITNTSITLAWASAAWTGGLDYVIGSSKTGGETVSDAEKTALRLCFSTWEDDDGSLIDFTESTNSAQQALTTIDDGDDGPNGLNQVVFDSDFSYFSIGSGVVAVTLPFFVPSTGQIVEADILLNSGQYTFSSQSTVINGQLDIQDVITHEVGHFIGIDHTPIGAATMFPYVNYAEHAKRSLSADDIAAAAIIRPPSSSSLGNISGTIFHSDGTTPVSRPHVVALDSNGNVSSAIYGATSGTYTLTGLAAGNYTVYATPFFGVVISDNLNDDDVFESSTDNDFSMTFHGGNASPTAVVVTAGATTSSTNVTCNDPFTSLGEFDGPISDPYQVNRSSSTSSVTLSGSGFTSASLEISNPGSADVTASSTSVGASSVTFTANATISAALGMRDVRLKESGTEKRIVYPGILEVLAPTPSISNVSPTVGTKDGGTTVTISGANFSGTTTTLKVIFGDVLGTVTAVSNGSITVTSPEHDAEVVDIGVINADGQGALSADAFTYNPTVSAVFPDVVSDSGGSTVILTGAGFASGATVTIEGTSATSVSVVSATKITFSAPVKTAGSDYDIVVTNTDGGTVTVTDGLSYVSLPDPTVTAVSTDTFSTRGGTRVTITGTNFVDGAAVIFGVNEDTGSGGTAATVVTFQSATSLLVTAPAVSAGAVHIKVANPNGQSAILSSAGTYIVPSSGGGGCFGVTSNLPIPPADKLGNLLPFLLLFFFLSRWRSRKLAL